MAIRHYDPFEPPDPGQWLALDESERIKLVLDYHVGAQIELPNARVHAVVHVAVESQIALGDETPVREKLRRLMAQGLDRHDAIHAIGWVLTDHLYGALREGEAADNLTDRYYAALKRLNSRRWRRLR
jgi:hypothetical protein